MVLPSGKTRPKFYGETGPGETDTDNDGILVPCSGGCFKDVPLKGGGDFK